MINFEFAGASFTNSAAFHDAIAYAWVGAGAAVGLCDAEGTLADFDREAGVVESEAGWHLSTFEGYDRAELRAAVKRLRDTLLEEDAVN